MLDYLKKLRLQSIFGNPESMNPGMEPTFPSTMGPQNIDPSGGMQPQQNDGIEEMLNRLYTPENTQQTRLNTMLDSYPKEPQPSGWRRTGGAIAGALTDIGKMFGGVGNGMNTYNEVIGRNKYDRDIEDWKTQIGPTERAASLEKQGNVNERTTAMQTISAKLREEAEQHRVDKNETEAKIRQQRADVYEFKARNPNLKIVITKGGNVMAINPVTGESHDTGIPSGSLSDADRLALTQENALERIHATGDEARDTAGVRHENTTDEIVTRGEQSRLTKTVVPGKSSVDRPELPSQTRIRQRSTAQELYNTRADLRPFIKINGNDFTITPPSQSALGGRSGPTPQQFQEINEKIYGSTIPAPMKSGGSNMSPSNMSPSGSPQAPPGWKYVRKPGGGWTAVREGGQ